MYRLIPLTRQSDLSNLFDEFDRRFFGSDGQLPDFRTDIRDQGDSYLLEADQPGFRKEDIDLHLQDGVLTITARRQHTEGQQGGKYICRERRTGSFSRAFDVSGIREEGITAAYDNGVLRLTLPKQGEILPPSRKITIE